MKKALFLIMAILIQKAYPSSRMFFEPWDERISAPEIMSFNFQKNFKLLPLIGKISPSQRMWPGNYCPLYKGNINYRWYSGHKTGFNLNSPGKEQARQMSISELAQLAPSEKYDLFLGRYDYPLKHEVAKIADPNSKVWEGICHGWSPATINHNEPYPKVMINPDGIEVPFGSSDIKALLSYYYAHIHRASDTYQMGRRCYSKKDPQADPNCRQDLNAGAFHVVLANRIGLEEKSFVADLNRFEEVWNHPVSAFESRILGEYRPTATSAPGTLKVIRIKTTVSYLDGEGLAWRPFLGENQQYMKVTYQYDLELNSKNEIIGGEWLSGSRPDFLWYMGRPYKFQGILSHLEELLND